MNTREVIDSRGDPPMREVTIDRRAAAESAERKIAH